jgi:Mrp family chromosome partitioning ATPase
MEIAEYIDAVIVVVESERVRREILSKAVSTLDRSGINIFGVVLNNYRYYLPHWLYKRL